MSSKIIFPSGGHFFPVSIVTPKASSMEAAVATEALPRDAAGANAEADPRTRARAAAIFIVTFLGGGYLEDSN